jgi:hypothetical protein
MLFLFFAEGAKNKKAKPDEIVKILKFGSFVIPVPDPVRDDGAGIHYLQRVKKPGPRFSTG